MSIFGSLTTAISGLQAQSKSLGNISDNIANSQTIGYKRVDTSFNTLVLQSNADNNDPGGVRARPAYTNDIQGNPQQVQRSTNLQLQGAGFFSVSKLLTTSSGATVPSQERFYTRDGSFDLNDQRVLVNNSGFALNGFKFDVKEGRFATAVAPIQVTADIDAPVATKSITLSANLPDSPPPDKPISATNIQIFDASGNPRNITLNWRPAEVQNSWRLTIDTPDAIGSKPLEGSLPGFTVGATATSTVLGVPARAQQDTVTFQGPAIKIGDVYSVVVSGTTYKSTITQANAGAIQNLAGVSQTLADAINGAVPPAGVIATVVNGNLRVTSVAAGTSFTTSASVTNGSPSTNGVQGPVVTAPTATAGEIRRFTITGSTIDIGDVFSIDIDGDSTNDASVTVSASNISGLRDVNGVVQALAAQVNAQSPQKASATANGSDLTLTNLTANQDFQTQFGALPSVSITNGSTVSNNASSATTVGNILGSRQIQRVSLQGVAGDVGATYSVRLQSPNPVQVAAANIVQTVAPAVGTAEQVAFSFGAPGTATQVGEQYSMTIEGMTYSLLITSANQATFATRGDVVYATGGLISIIQNDALGPVSATGVSGNPPIASPADTGILVTCKTTNVTMTKTQPTPSNFDQTITYTTTGAEASLDEIAGLIASKINGNGQVPVTASAAGGVLTITGNADTVSFLTNPNALPGQTPANIGLTFGGTLSDGSRGNPGALTAINMSRVGTGNATSSALRDPGDPAQIVFAVDYGDGPQTIKLDVGKFNDNRGLTQFQGDDINVTSLLQDGSPQGTFQNVEITSNGDVVANYDNGRRRTIARIPIILFNNPNALSRDSGNVFTETVDSGRARFNDVGLNGAGTLVASSLEGSNVDIADEFTKLIVAQRSYTANTRVITTTDEMLTDTLNMKR